MRPSLYTSWRQTVERDPAAVALIDGGTARTWTRAELDAEVNAWVAALPEDLNLRGAAVVFTLPNGLEWWRAFLGLQKLGAVPAALDPQEPHDAQLAAAHAIGAKWLWREGAMMREDPRSTLEASPSLPPLSSLPAPRARPCLYKITSGSTGTPKVFPFTAAQMLADGKNICATMDIRSSDLNLAVIPFGHSYGLGNLVIPLIAQGTALLCAASPLPQALAGDCARWRATVFPAVPTLLRALTASDLAADALASLRVVISAGAPLAAEPARAFAEKFQRAIHNFYGSSETGGICYDRSGDATVSGRSVGQPLEGVMLRFGAGRRFSVKSAAVMNRGLHVMADRGELNADGELVLLGRADRAIKIAGRRLDLGEIESVLRSLPGVLDAFVIAHPQRPEALAAAVATEHSVDTLRSLLSSRLATWKIPARLIALPEFPMTARGKIDALALRSLLNRTQ